MASAWIARRTTKQGETRFRVMFKAGGREAPQQYAGTFRTLREARILEPNLGLRRSYPNLLAAQYFAALIEAITEAGTPLPGEYELFAKALRYLCDNEVSPRAVDRFERRILTLAGLGRGEQDLPHAFRTLHHTVPSLRDELLKLLVKAGS